MLPKTTNNNFQKGAAKTDQNYKFSNKFSKSWKSKKQCKKSILFKFSCKKFNDESVVSNSNSIGYKQASGIGFFQEEMITENLIENFQDYRKRSEKQRKGSNRYPLDKSCSWQSLEK